jgi:hypothetical protein
MDISEKRKFLGYVYFSCSSASLSSTTVGDSFLHSMNQENLFTGVSAESKSMLLHKILYKDSCVVCCSTLSGYLQPNLANL